MASAGSCNAPLQRGGQNPYLENGHSIRYSDHMSTPCAAAAPTRHPPGEAHAAPRVLSPQTAWVAQVAVPSGYLGGAAARGSTTSSSIEVALSPHDNTTGDTPTPNHPTTSACCRQKRIRRHQATHHRVPGRRSRRRLTTSSSIEVALSPRDNTTGDTPTPTHPTTSACCRQKRIRRHQATRDKQRLPRCRPLPLAVQ